MTFRECFKRLADGYPLEEGDFFNPDELKGWCHDVWNEARRTDPEKDHLRAEINLLRASMHNAVQTHFVKCNQCGVYKEDGLICWNCREDE